jgi:mono/diheme cytochrome c family protein
MSKSLKGPWVVVAFIAAAVIAGLIAFNPPKEKDTGHAVVVPANLNAQARNGQAVFNRVCAECHGENAKGGPGGPSLMHAVYWPNHHADGAFRLAVKNGVRAHHWGFGNMPAQKDKVSEAEVEDIIVFVRELQRANRTTPE